MICFPLFNWICYTITFFIANYKIVAKKRQHQRSEGERGEQSKLLPFIENLKFS